MDTNPIVKKHRSFRPNKGSPNKCWDVYTEERTQKRYRVWASSRDEAAAIVGMGQMVGEEIKVLSYYLDDVEEVESE